MIVESQILKMWGFFKKKKNTASETPASCLAFRNQVSELIQGESHGLTSAASTAVIYYF